MLFRRPTKVGLTVRGMLLTASLLVSSTLALAVSAQTPNDYGLTQTAQRAGLPTGTLSLPKATAAVVNTVLSIVGVIVIIIIIYGGFLWMTSAGNEEKITKAKKLLTGAVVGLVIIFAAYAVAVFITFRLANATGVTQPTPEVYGPPAPPTSCSQISGSCFAVCGSNETDWGNIDCGALHCCVHNP